MALLEKIVIRRNVEMGTLEKIVIFLVQSLSMIPCTVAQTYHIFAL